MTTEQNYFLTVAIINLILAFSGTRIKDPIGKPKCILFFIMAMSANCLSWFLYAFDIGTSLKIISVMLSATFIWGMVAFSYRRCEQPLPVSLISLIFILNCLALGYFTYTEHPYKALHVSAFFVPLALSVAAYLFIKKKPDRNSSDLIFAYACCAMSIVVIIRSLLLEISPNIFNVTIIASQIIWPAFNVIVGVFTLLSFTEDIQLRLQKESNTDQLTGLANRRSMDNILKQEWAKAERHQRLLALVMLDIDFFKNYNDHYGHQAGDDCLKKVAQAILDSGQRASDVSVRYGGEEFLLILPDTDALAAKKIANKVRASIAALDITHQDSPFDTVTVSAGVAVQTQRNFSTIRDLLMAADAALYQAKNNGRNQIQIMPFEAE
ncbi:GGDEF domain-containing protein [Amphritea opalescens]|uniref:diguanylate cyclase n=1 Tax=Amphritea opalescens TaxID=2490544 RepID=A0A430KMN2_9GAMM|nr:diguanylate cyclase [Amphritea opalescens]RTE64732.1 GGDEF domain-containing protein [Amphritea opalescens]